MNEEEKKLLAEKKEWKITQPLTTKNQPKNPLPLRFSLSPINMWKNDGAENESKIFAIHMTEIILSFGLSIHMCAVIIYAWHVRMSPSSHPPPPKKKCIYINVMIIT